MTNDKKFEKKQKKSLSKEREEEFEKRIPDNPKALKNQSKFKQIVWWIVIFFIIFYGFEFFLYLVSFLQ